MKPTLRRVAYNMRRVILSYMAQYRGDGNVASAAGYTCYTAPTGMVTQSLSSGNGH